MHHDNPWFDMDDRHQDQVKCGYMPRSASTPTMDRGMQQTTQVKVKCEYIRRPRSASTPRWTMDRGVGDLQWEAGQLCTLKEQQELVTHHHNSSMTGMCVQSWADSVSQVRETTAAPMEHDSVVWLPVCVPEFRRQRS